jgi:hypothetical protein
MLDLAGQHLSGRLLPVLAKNLDVKVDLAGLLYFGMPVELTMLAGINQYITARVHWMACNRTGVCC